MKIFTKVAEQTLQELMTDDEVYRLMAREKQLDTPAPRASTARAAAFYEQLGLDVRMHLPIGAAK